MDKDYIVLETGKGKIEIIPMWKQIGEFPEDICKYYESIFPKDGREYFTKMWNNKQITIHDLLIGEKSINIWYVWFDGYKNGYIIKNDDGTYTSIKRRVMIEWEKKVDTIEEAALYAIGEPCKDKCECGFGFRNDKGEFKPLCETVKEKE